MSEADTFQTSPFLSLKFGDENSLVIDDYFRKRTFLASRESITFLAFCLQSRSRNEIGKFLASQSLPPAVEEEAFECGLLVSTRDEVWTFYERCKRWKAYGWEAAAYLHASTFNYPFLNYASESAFAVDNGLMRTYMAAQAPPEPTKDYRDRPVVNFDRSMPYPNVCGWSLLGGGYPECYSGSFKERLGLFLSASFSATKEVEMYGMKTLRKTAPSGGALHPIETYVAIFSSDFDFVSGLYYFHPIECSLRSIKYGRLFDDLNSLAHHSVSEKQDSILFAVIHTCRVLRAMWRYRDLRSTRAIFADLGHLSENSRLVAQSVGFEFVSDYPAKLPLLSKLCETSFLVEPALQLSFFKEHHIGT